MSTLNFQSKSKVEAPSRDLPLSPPVRERAYVEIPGLRHETRDVLKQLNANILLLEDLSGRLGFITSELRSLIRR